MRLLPHPPNLVPVTALALFSGAYLEDRRLAFILPLAALFLSDLVLGFYPGMVFVYAGFALSVVIGFLLSQRRSIGRIAGATLASALIFFLVRNFGSWLALPFYPKTPDGLVAAYLAGIPFLRNALFGDLIYVIWLFGGFALAERHFPWLNSRLAHT